mmetsp:Transcript_20166/g.35855  ORF Transcript_20166/g.35855 Transcript_20166/m.35855 type:complete len:788 (-) Transcript_20166:92-2455(-)
MLRLLGAVVLVAACATNEVGRPPDAALIAGSSKLTATEAESAEEQLNTLEREEEKSRQAVSRLQDQLESVKEIQSEEEGELEVSKAEEEELEKQAQEAGLHENQAGSTPSFLQTSSEDSVVESQGSAARELRKLTAQLAAAQASLDEARSTAKSSQERLREQSAELAEVHNLVKKVQKFDDSIVHDATEKDEVLEDTHKMLTNPLVAEATSLGLPTPEPILAQLASQDVSFRNQKASFLEQQLHSAKKAVEAQNEEVERRQQQLLSTQTKLQEASKINLGGALNQVSKLKKRSTILLQQLQGTTRADQAEFQRATTETKRLKEVMASKEEELAADKSALVSERKASAAAASHLKQQQVQTSQVQIKVAAKTKELQAAKEQLQTSVKDLAQLNQTMSDSLDLQQESGVEQTGELQLSGLQHSLEKVQASAKELKQQMGQLQKLTSDVEAAVEKEQRHEAAKAVEEQVTEEHVHGQEKVNKTKKQIVMLAEKAVRHQESIQSTYAARASQAEAQHKAAMAAAQERMNQELKSKEAAIQAQKSALDNALYDQQTTATEEAQKTGSQIAMLEEHLAQVKVEQQELQHAGLAEMAEQEAELRRQRSDLESTLQNSKHEVIAVQNSELDLSAAIHSVHVKLDEAVNDEAAENKKLESVKAEHKRKAKSLEDELAKVREADDVELQSDEYAHSKKLQEMQRDYLEQETKTENDLKEAEERVSKAKQSYAEDAPVAVAAEKKELQPLVREMKRKKLELSKVRGFLAREQTLSSAAQEQLEQLSRFGQTDAHTQIA